MSNMTVIQPYLNFVYARAHNAGYKAFQEGYERRAPVEVGEYAGAWVEGWNQAALDALDAGKYIAMAA